MNEKSIIPQNVQFVDSEKALGRTLRNTATPSKPGYDGDGDGFIINPATGRDDVPFKAPKPSKGKDFTKLFPERSDEELVKDWEGLKPCIPSGGKIGMNPAIEDEKRKKRMLIEFEMGQRGIKKPKEKEKVDFSKFFPDDAKPDANPKKPADDGKPKFDLKPPPANPDTKENIFDGTSSEEIFKDMNSKIPWIKKLRAALSGEGIPASNLRRGSGETKESYQDRIHRELKTSVDRLNELQRALKRRGYEDAELARLDYNRSKRAGKSLISSELFLGNINSINIEGKEI